MQCITWKGKARFEGKKEKKWVNEDLWKPVLQEDLKMSNLVIGTCKRSDMGWRRVSVNLHNLIKSFPFWNLTSNSEMGLFNLAATIWSHFFLCWCMEKTGYNISICTFLPQSPNKDTLVNFPNSRVLQTLSWKPVIPLSRSVPPSKPTLTHTSPWHIHVFLLAIPSNSVHLQKKKKSWRTVCDYLTWVGE